MFKNLKFKISDYFIRLKRSVADNKTAYILALVAVILGVFIGLCTANVPDEPSNVITEIADGSFNYFLFFLKVIFLTAIVYVLGWLLTFNIVAFWSGNLLIIGLFSMYMAKKAVIACCASWTGIILLVLWYIPLLLVNLLIFINYICKLRNVAFICCKWNAINPLKASYNGALKAMKWYLIFALIFNVVYIGIFLVLFSICF